MMKTVHYLKRKLSEGYSPDEALQQLTDEFAIKVKSYEEGLAVLNYNQIESPKTHPIVMECRGLILDGDTFEVVSRSFDRFFNLGEAPDTYTDFDITRSTVYEKADGSLIKLYCWQGDWYVSTRGTAFAETENYTGQPFKDLVLEALGVESLGDVDMPGSEGYTFMFEFTSPLNRVVTPYDKPEMVLLAVRNNQTGEYVEDYQDLSSSGLEFRVANTFDLSDEESIKKAVKDLPNLQEGYVCWDKISNKRVKIKSPAYLAVHKLRGESIPTPKRIMALVLTKEEEEYLAYFPEDRKLFDPYSWALSDLEAVIEDTWEKVKGIHDQKEFAMSVKQLPFSGCLFQARSKQQEPVHCFHEGRESYKMQVLTTFMEEQNA